MTEVDGETLASQEGGFVEHARNTVHLDQVLDVLLFAQPLKSQLKLAVLADAVADPASSVVAASQAAAQIDEIPEEAMRPVASA